MSYCERSAAAAEDCGEDFSHTDLQACRDALAECTSDDAKLLDEMLDCLEDAGLFGCSTTDTSPGGTDEFAAALDCFEPLSGLTETCASGMGMAGTTSSTGTTTM